MRAAPLAAFFALCLATFVHAMVREGSGSNDACPCDAGTNRSALMDLYMATQGPSWGPGANWGVSGPICAWVGLSCNGTGLVMNLDSFNLNGTLPDDFGAHLPNLESLNIEYSVSFEMEPWPLPASLGLSRGLKSLYLSGSFEGPLPEEWSALSQLSSLGVSANFSGRVPSWAGMNQLESLVLFSTLNAACELSEASLALPSLTYLSVTGNLTGVLPSSWANMARLQNLFIETYGAFAPRRSLPESWGAMQSLTVLALSGGVAGWTLPASWAGMTALQQLGLSFNELVGTLPPSWSALLDLQQLKLAGNSFTGPLPKEWSSMVKLETLTLGDNRLTGPLPASWSALQNLKYLSLRNNGLSGELPASWAKLQNLVELELSSNALSGSVPDAWWNFSPQQLNLRNNTFKGTVPRNWTMRQGSAIDISQNAFTGALPSLVNATAPTNAITFTANRNNFTGHLPAEWYEDPNFVFKVNHNQLTGTPDLCAVNQSGSSLSYNDFSGTPNISCFGPSPCANSVLQGFLTGNHFCGICGLPNCTCNDLPDHSIADDGNIAVLEVKNSNACCQACRANAACVAAVLVPYHKYTYCYLKNTTTPLVPKPGHTVLLRAD